MMKRSVVRSRLILLSCAVIALTGILPALAQTTKTLASANATPPAMPKATAAQAPATPVAPAAAPNAVVDPNTFATAPATTTPPAQNGGSVQTGAAVVGASDPAVQKELQQRVEVKDPCPLPEGLNTSGMSDLARIQEDIDRYTLCIQRADLLAQLNETETKNKQAFDQALGLSDGAGGGADLLDGGDVPPPPAGAQTGRIEPMSESALGVDVAPKGQSARAPEVATTTDWQVDSILGNGRNLKAVLVAGDGTLRRVQAGEELPNDGGKVASITASDVKLQKGKSTISLTWAEKTSTQSQKDK